MINILLLNWNSLRASSACIRSILESKLTAYRIYLIDNASDDQDAVKRYVDSLSDERISVILSERNLGYAGGNNLGFQYLDQNNIAGDVLVLNPDVLLEEDTLEAMASALTGNVGAVMVRTRSPDERQSYDFLKLDGFRTKFCKTYSRTTIETDYVAGSCFLVCRKVLDEVGYFDDDFFMYWEEVDLSMRIASAGYILVSCLSTSISRALNPPSRSSSALYYSVRNSKLIKERYGFRGHPQYLLRLFFSALKSSCRNGSTAPVKSYFNGLRSFW